MVKLVWRLSEVFKEKTCKSNYQTISKLTLPYNLHTVKSFTLHTASIQSKLFLYIMETKYFSSESSKNFEIPPLCTSSSCCEIRLYFFVTMFQLANKEAW